MVMPTYDMRESWQSQRSAAEHAHGLGVSSTWEEELGQGSIDQDTWLVSFADILMLLLTLFVLLLAYKDDPVQTPPVQTVAAATVVEVPAVSTQPSVTEAQLAQIEAIAQTPPPQAPSPYAHEAAHQETLTEAALESTAEPTVLMTALPELRLSTPPRKPMTQIAGMPGMFGLPEVLEDTPQPERVVQAESQADTPSRDTGQKPVDTLLAELQDSALQGRVEVTVLPDSVNLEISDSILFAPASAALTVSGAQLLDELAITLKTHPYTLSVEGHTDNVPIGTARFPSNWELSSTRATEVTRRLIERGIAPERVRAVGYADTHPRADNASVEGRSRNRRVSLVLMEQPQ